MEKNKINKTEDSIKLRSKIITIFGCLLVSFIFWIFNALSHDNATTISYPIELELDNQKFINYSSSKKNIKIAVSGYGWTLLSRSLGIGNTPILFFPNALENNKIDVQTKILPILKDRIKDLKIIQVMEDYVYFDVQKKNSKQIYLKLDVSKLTLPTSSKISSKIEINPAYIVCNGPEKQINALPDSIFFTIPDQFIEKNFSDMVDINYRPAADITLAYNNVKVNFSISKKQ